MSTSLPRNFRVVYARVRASDPWTRVAKCSHSAAQIEAKVNGGDPRVWRGFSDGLAVLAISPALEAR